MANINCLEGIRCPKCRYEDGFTIRCEGWFEDTDDRVVGLMRKGRTGTIYRRSSVMSAITVLRYMTLASWRLGNVYARPPTNRRNGYTLC